MDDDLAGFLIRDFGLLRRFVTQQLAVEIQAVSAVAQQRAVLVLGVHPGDHRIQIFLLGRLGWLRNQKAQVQSR